MCTISFLKSYRQGVDDMEDKDTPGCPHMAELLRQGIIFRRFWQQAGEHMSDLGFI